MYLKSNMDRFIENGCSIIPKTNENLKSNMDRFIDIMTTKQLVKYAFKIQYG